MKAKTKKCNMCGVEQDLKCFSEAVIRNPEKMGKCRKCFNERRRIIAKAWYKAHPEKVREANKKWLSNPENRKAQRVYAKKYSADHKEHTKAHQAEYYKANKEKMIAKGAARRARIKEELKSN